MIKQLWSGEATAGSERGSPVRWDFSSLCLGDFLSRLEGIDPHPAVLDLGVLCGDNIAFLGARGCRVSIESLPEGAPSPRPAEKEEGGGEDRTPPPRSPLSYPPETFSGVLAWDAIARMHFEEATAFTETLRRLLLPGGVVLAYFPGPPGDATPSMRRYRINSADQLTVELSGRLPHKPRSFQNREIYSLFSRFDVVRLSHLKTGTREVLLAKSRRARTRN